MKKLLITGGRGFIGKNLVEHLKDKYEVFAPTHSELDLLDEAAVEHYIVDKNINIIVHAANIGGNRKRIETEVVQKNLKMFFNIVRCKDHVEKIVHLGSGAEYDKRKPLAKVKEEEFDRTIPEDDYGFSKYVMSKYIESSDNMVCLRLFGVYGKYEDFEYKFISNSIVKNLLHLPIEIRQNVYFDYLYIKDCLNVIEWFLENESSHKLYNLCTGTPIDLYTLAKLINNASDIKSEITIVNEGLNKEYSADNQRLRNDMPDFKFTDPQEAISELYQYYKGIINDIDTETIVNDPYAQKCNITKG